MLNAALPEKAPPSRGGCGSGCIVAFPGDLRTVLVSRPGRGGWRAARVQRVCEAAAYLRHSRSVAAAARHPPLAGGCQTLHGAGPRWSTRIARVTGRQASPGAEGVARARAHPLADCQRAQGHASATPQVRAAMVFTRVASTPGYFPAPHRCEQRCSKSQLAQLAARGSMGARPQHPPARPITLSPRPASVARCVSFARRTALRGDRGHRYRAR